MTEEVKKMFNNCKNSLINSNLKEENDDFYKKVNIINNYKINEIKNNDEVDKKINVNQSSSSEQSKNLCEHEIKKRLLDKNYNEIHSYIKLSKCNFRKLNHCFRNKMRKGTTLKAKQSRDELKKRVCSFESDLQYVNIKNVKANDIEYNIVVRDKSDNNKDNQINKLIFTYSKKKEIEKNKEEEKINKEDKRFNDYTEKEYNNTTDNRKEIVENKQSVIIQKTEKYNSNNNININIKENINENENEKEKKKLNIENGKEKDNKKENEDEMNKKFKAFFPNKVRKGVFAVILTEKEKEDLLLYVDKGPDFSNSIKEQNEKILEEYLFFCKQMNFTPFPLDKKNSVGFLHFLGETKTYNISSIHNVVYYALLRLNLIISESPVSEEADTYMKCEIEALYKNPKVKQSSEGMTPIIISDLKIIINNIPDIDPEKPKIASMFLFALSTGSRASTVRGVKLCHLLYYYNRNDKYGNWAISIKQEIIKSKNIKNKSAVISGKPGYYDPLNFIYWLEEYLKKQFKTNIKDLVEYNIKNPEVRQEYLWPMSTKSMSACLKRRTEKAGLKLKKVGMHSLRSGFLSSAILNCEGDEERIRAVMERCAIVAVWKAFTPAQLTYLKSSLRAAVVGSDLIGSSKTDANGLQSVSTSENFHQIKLTQPSPPKSYISLVKDKIKELISYPPIYNIFNIKYFERIFNSSLYTYTKERFAHERLPYPRARSKAVKYINDIMKQNPNNINIIAQEFVKIMKEKNKLIYRWETTEQKKPTSYVTKRNEQLSRPAGKKIIKACWSEKEQEIFLKGIEGGKSLKEITNLLPFRCYTDCYDHYRAINKSRKSNGVPLLKLVKSERKKRNKNTKLIEYKTVPEEKQTEEEEEEREEEDSENTDKENSEKENEIKENYEANNIQKEKETSLIFDNTNIETNHEVMNNNNFNMNNIRINNDKYIMSNNNTNNKNINNSIYDIYSNNNIHNNINYCNYFMNDISFNSNMKDNSYISYNNNNNISPINTLPPSYPNSFSYSLNSATSFIGATSLNCFANNNININNSCSLYPFNSFSPVNAINNITQPFLPFVFFAPTPNITPFQTINPYIPIPSQLINNQQNACFSIQPFENCTYNNNISNQTPQFNAPLPQLLNNSDELKPNFN